MSSIAALARRVYDRTQLLRMRAYSSAASDRLPRRVRRSLWFLGLLCIPSTTDVFISEATRSCTNDIPQDSRIASPEPRESVPTLELTPRTASAQDDNNQQQTTDRKRHLPNRLSIATFNARTLNADWRIQELLQLAVDLDIAILGIQEHRRSTSTDVHLSHSWQLKLAPASPSGTGGIGFLLSPSASRALLDLYFPSDRIGVASFALKDRRLHVVCVYAPTAPRTVQDPQGTEAFYDVLGNILDSFPARDLHFLLGDFNAPLSPDGRLVKNRCGTPNANSDYLYPFISARDLVTVNGCLRQRFCKLATFFGPNNRITRLDWILCPYSQRTRVRRIRNIRPCSVNSDHSVVVCDSDLRWQISSQKKARPRVLWEALRDPQLHDSFVNRLRTALPTDHLSADAFSSAVASAACVLPKHRPDQPKSPLANDPAISQARRILQRITVRHGHDSDAAKDARHDLTMIHAHRAEDLISEAVNNIELATDSCRHSAAWRAINALTGRKSRPHSIVSANSIEHRKSLLVSHYSQVLNAPPPTASPLPIDDFTPALQEDFETGPITVMEVTKTLRTMRADAAPGVDNVSPRVLKLPEFTTDITRLLNTYCCLGGDDSASVASQWRISQITSIPKKGNSTSLDNQRGISLQCAAIKLLNAVLRNRLLPCLNQLLLPLQSGFRPGRSAVEQICAIRAVIDSCRTRQRSVSIVFVDFKKAFDSISRSAIAWVLSYYGVPAVLVAAVMDLYGDSKAFVQTSDGPTVEFSTTSGVLQGDTLAPVLFITVVDYVLRRCLQNCDSFLLRPRRSSRHPSVPLPALAYADDIALLCRDPESAQRALNRLCEEGARVGLLVNAKKTEVLHIGNDTSTVITLPGGEPVSQCQDFRYLGSIISSPTAIISERRAQAWRASHLLRKFFNSSASDDSKKQLFRAAVEPILLYGLEGVPMTATREKTIDAHYRALLRYALGIHFPERISSRDLMSRTGVPELSDTLRRRRQRLIGHGLRNYHRGCATPLALVLLNPPSERLRRGQAQTQCLLDTLFQDLSIIGLTPNETVLCSSILFRQRVRAN